MLARKTARGYKKLEQRNRGLQEVNAELKALLQSYGVDTVSENHLAPAFRGLLEAYGIPKPFPHLDPKPDNIVEVDVHGEAHATPQGSTTVMGAPMLTDQQMDIDGSLFEEDDDFTICTLAEAPQPTSQPQDTAAPSTGPAPASEDPAGQIDVQAMQQRAIAMTQQRLNASGGKPQPGQRGPKLPAGLQGSGPSGTVSTKDLTPLDEQMRMLQDFNARQAQGQIIEPAQPSPGPGPQGGDQSGGFGGF